MQSYTLFAQWSAVGNGLNGQLFNFLEWNSKLYLLGAHSSGTDTLCGIAAYNGTNYSAPMPPGFLITSAAIYNNEFYAGGGGGGFTNCGTLPPGTNNIAKWNGSGWSSVGGGGPGGTDVINAMAVYNGELYVVGNFTSMGGNPNAHRIAKWNGSTWSGVGGAFPLSVQANILCVAVYNGELYVGGSVGLPNGPNHDYYNLVRWNGTQWDSVGGKFGPGYVKSLCVDSVNNILYIGGGITYADTIPIWSVAKWNGTNLSAPGMGITMGAYAMTMYQGKLIVGGNSWSDTTLATWDGTYWCQMLPAPNNTVTALEAYNGDLYVGGEFDSIGAFPFNYLAKWSGNPCPNSGINTFSQNLKFKVFPNPATSEINITVEGTENKEYLAVIYNSVGVKVNKKKFTKQTKISTASFSKGIYQVQVCDTDGKICHTEKVVLE
jgi:hypothetical protein